MKNILQSKCNVFQVELKNHDDEHFTFWNDLNLPILPSHCSGNKEQSNCLLQWIF